jgi:hypothetical protein
VYRLQVTHFSQTSNTWVVILPNGRAGSIGSKKTITAAKTAAMRAL